MTQFSIRDIDPATATRLKRNAKRKGQSLNRYLQAALRRVAVGEETPGYAVHEELDTLAGTWSSADARAFEGATAPFADVDKALWR